MFTQDQLALQAFIDESNVNFANQAKENNYQVISTTVSDPAHWAEYGVTTIDQYKHYMAAETFFSMYKAVYDVKPRWINANLMTLAEIEQEIHTLELQQQYDEEYKKRIQEEENRQHRERIKLNAYKPNLAFANLKEMLQNKDH